MSHPVAEERPAAHGDALNLVRAAEVVGEIDIDGSDLDAFDTTHARFLEEVAALLAPLRPRS